jgi:hypothetical protein
MLESDTTKKANLQTMKPGAIPIQWYQIFTPKLHEILPNSSTLLTLRFEKLQHYKGSKINK